MAIGNFQLICALVLAGVSWGAGDEVKWAEVRGMPLPRAGYMAGTDGRRLLLAGGTYWEGGTKKWSSRADWYDPEKDVWQPAPSLPFPVGDAASVSFGGRVFVLGGGADGAVSGDTLVLEDGAWRKLESWSLPAPRLYPVSAVLDGRVYVVGGLAAAGDYAHATATVWSRRLDGEEGWRRHAPIPGPGRAHFALAPYRGRLYLFGGMTEADGQFVNLAGALEYDPAVEKWRALPDAPVARRAWGAAPWQGRILLLGGYSEDFSGQVYSFDPRTARYTLSGTLPRPVADARFVRAAGKLLTAGGESGPKIRAPWTWAGMARSSGTVVAFGDSVTLGVRPGLVTLEETYSAQLERMLDGAKVINAGVGGNDTGHLLARLDRDVLSRGPNVVVLMVGLNDAAYVDPGPVARTSPRISSEAFRRNLITLVERIRAGGSRVLLVTPNPMTQAYAHAGFGYYATHDINASLDQHREAMLDAARELRCPVVDLYAAWRDRRDLDRLLVDGIHPGVEGHARIAELLLPAVEELLP